MLQFFLLNQLNGDYKTSLSAIYIPQLNLFKILKKIKSPSSNCRQSFSRIANENFALVRIFTRLRKIHKCCLNL